MRSLAMALVLSLVACKAGSSTNPQTWIRQLDDSDPKARVKAVQQLRKLKAKKAAPQVAELLKDPLVKEDAALALEDLGGPDEVQPLLDAVDTTVGAGSDTAARTANRANAKIAQALGNIGDPRAAPALLRLARASDDSVRLSAVEALGQIRSREAIPELSHLVDDPAAPPVLTKKAIVSLGEIGDPLAIPALEHGLVLERQGVSFLPESSFALFVLGEAAVEPLLRIAQDQDPAYLAWARENNRAQAGTYAKAALVLGDLEDPRAIPVLLAKLKYVDADPVPGTSRLLTNLVRMFSANALGKLRAAQAAAQIQGLVATANAQDEELVSYAAEALVWLGERAQAGELMKKAQSGVLRLRLIAARSAALFGEPSLAKELLALAQREAKALATVLRPAARRGGPLRGSAEGLRVAVLAVQRARQAFDAARGCASDARCWLGKVRDPSPAVRARAAYELGRAGAADAVPSLVQAAADEHLLVRAAAVRALDWLAAVPAAKTALKAAAQPLAAQLVAEQEKTGFMRVNEDLRRLQVKLSRL